MVGEDPWGRSIQKLIQDFPQKDLLQDYEKWVQAAAHLDRFYIPTRYPYGLPDLTPGQVYRMEEAQQAIELAERFVQQTEELLESQT